MEGADQANIARREGLTRARVTQVMGMLRHSSVIRQGIPAFPEIVSRPALTERALRPIT